MGWRHDIHYVFAYRTSKGSTNDALALLASVPLDDTCKVEARPSFVLAAEPDEYGRDVLNQRGAVVTVHFSTVHAKGWKSDTLDAIDTLLAAGKLPGDLYTMAGDNDDAMRYGIEQYENVKITRERQKQFIAGLKDGAKQD